jgi:hypothetical protein
MGLAIHFAQSKGGNPNPHSYAIWIRIVIVDSLIRNQSNDRRYSSGNHLSTSPLGCVECAAP